MATAKKQIKGARVTKPTPKKKTPSKSAGRKKAASQSTAPFAKPARAPSATSHIGKPEKAERQKKSKLVRDSFTIPKDEYTGLQALKQRAADSGRPSKKSEILRAGIRALASLTGAAFAAALRAVPAIKTGRPSKDGDRPAGL